MKNEWIYKKGIVDLALTATIQCHSRKMHLPVRHKDNNDENIGLEHKGKVGVGIF